MRDRRDGSILTRFQLGGGGGALTHTHTHKRGAEGVQRGGVGGNTTTKVLPPSSPLSSSSVIHPTALPPPCPPGCSCRLLTSPISRSFRNFLHCCWAQIWRCPARSISLAIRPASSQLVRGGAKHWARSCRHMESCRNIILVLGGGNAERVTVYVYVPQ